MVEESNPRANIDLLLPNTWLIVKNDGTGDGGFTRLSLNGSGTFGHRVL